MLIPFATETWHFHVIFLTIGSCRGTFLAVYTPAAIEVVGMDDRDLAFGFALACDSVSMVGAPLFGGKASLRLRLSRGFCLANIELNQTVQSLQVPKLRLVY